MAKGYICRKGGGSSELVRTLLGSVTTNGGTTTAPQTVTISATSIPNYGSLTADNFCAIPTTITRLTGLSGDDTSGTVALTYNATTGIVSLTYDYPRGGGVSWQILYNVYCYTV